MKKQAWIASGIAALLLLTVGAAWALGWFGGDDSPAAEIKRLAEAPPTDDTRRQMGEIMRQQTEGKTDEEKMDMFMNTLGPVFIPMMAKRFEQEYDKFMAMTPEDRNKELDKRIDDMQKGMNRWRRPGGQAGPNGAPRPQIEPKKMAEMNQKMLDWVTPDQRAKFQNGMKMFGDRMKQRGLTPPQMPGGGFF
jgi:hypothetical protein